MVSPIQEKLEDWKKAVAQIDKDHNKGKLDGTFFFGAKGDYSVSVGHHAELVPLFVFQHYYVLSKSCGQRNVLVYQNLCREP